MERWQADEDEIEQREKLAELVGTELHAREQELGISLHAIDDTAQITSYIPSMVRRLLRHEYAQIEWVYAEGLSPRRERVEDLSRILSAEGGVVVEGICAHVPVGALSIKGSPRKRDRPSGIVSTPKDARDVAKAFGGGGDE